MKRGFFAINHVIWRLKFDLSTNSTEKGHFYRTTMQSIQNFDFRYIFKV